MRVLRIITRLNIGGPTLQAIALTAHLRSRGYETLLLAGSCEADAGDAPYHITSTVQPVYVAELRRSVSPLLDVIAFMRIVKVIRRFRPDIVHTHLSKAGMLGRVAAILCGVPAIVHTYHGNTLSEYFSRVANGLFRLSERILGRLTSRVCVISQQQYTELVVRWRICKPSRTCIVPLGIEMKELLSIEPVQPSSRYRVAWLGRMVPIKNLGLLAGVINLITDARADIEFVVGGDGPERAGFWAALDEDARRRTTMLGWAEDVIPVLSSCDVVLQTSRNEGTPVALIQAMAAARPFVSTAVGGTIDMVGEPRGSDQRGRFSVYSNGILTRDDPTSVVAALNHLFNGETDLRAMGLAGRDFAAERYSVATLVESVDQLYREVCAGSKG